MLEVPKEEKSAAARTGSYTSLENAQPQNDNRQDDKQKAEVKGTQANQASPGKTLAASAESAQAP